MPRVSPDDLPLDFGEVPPDPRDARITELEAALASSKDTLRLRNERVAELEKVLRRILKWTSSPNHEDALWAIAEAAKMELGEQ